MKNVELKKLLRHGFRGFTAATGYRLYRGHTLFCREGDIFLGVHFDLSRFADGFSLSAFVMPLFEPRENLDLTLGGRIRDLPGKPEESFELPADESERLAVIAEARREIESKVLPWLSKRNTPRRILDVYRSEPEHVEIWTELGYCAAAVHDARAAAKYWGVALQWTPVRPPGIPALMQALEEGDFEAVDRQLQHNVGISEQALRIGSKTVTL